jgi:hypothetical protein
LIEDFTEQVSEKIDDVSEKAIAEIKKQKKGLLKKLFSWLKK